MANDPALVSVIIPTYNHAQFVRETLESIFAQTYTNTEVIVINDSSVDETETVLLPFIRMGWVRYYRQENKGMAGARNLGIEAAQGKYVAFLDDDDRWPPDKLAWQVQGLEENPQAVLIYGTMRSFGEGPEKNSPGGTAPSGEVWREFLRQNWIFSPGQTLMRAETVRAVGGFDGSLWGSDDWDLYIRLAAQGEFIFQDRLALHYRMHQANASRDSWKMYLNSRRVWRKHLGRIPAKGHVRLWLACEAYTRHVYFIPTVRRAQRYAEHGQLGPALATWWQAARMNPLGIGQILLNGLYTLQSEDSLKFFRALRRTCRGLKFRSG
jgi:glycosyltransferase involved in cell wall biosynthesis